MNSLPPSADAGSADLAAVCIRDTTRWLERAVIGLNLCPFAKAVHVKQQIHYVVADGIDRTELLQTLRTELQALVALPAQQRDTTLLIVPQGLEDFTQFNDLLDKADRLLRKLDLEGTLQIASFHPDYQFDGTEADDVTNCSNRSPYPTLHLLREESIDRAVEVFPEAEAIFEKNMQVLECLGMAGWQALDVGASRSGTHAACAGAAASPTPPTPPTAPMQGTL